MSFKNSVKFYVFCIKIYKSLILSCHSKSHVLSKRFKEHNHTVESMANIIRGHYLQGQTSNSYLL